MFKFLVKVFRSLYLLNMLKDQVETLHVVFKFLVKVFRSLYLLNMLKDQVETLHVGRYWSEVLCCTITTHLSDLEINVMGHRF